MSITNATDGGQKLVNLSIGFIVLQTVVLMLYYASIYAHEKPIPEIEIKFLVPFGYLFCVGNAVLSILFVEQGGVGHHIVNMDPEAKLHLAKLFNAEEMIYMTSITLPKLAVLSLYIRLFMDPIRKLSYTTGTAVVLNFAAGFVVWGLSCQPFGFNWNKSLPKGHCINTNITYTYVSVFNLLSDTAIVILPLQPLWTLHVPRIVKFGVFATFMLGSIGMIMAIIRFVSFLRCDIRSDPSFQAADTMKWTIIEPAMYQIAATLPTLRPIVAKCISVFCQFPGARSVENYEGRIDAVLAVQDGTRIVTLDDYRHIHKSTRLR